MTFEEKIKDIQWEYEDKMEAERKAFSARIEELNAEREELAAQNAEKDQLAIEKEHRLAEERAKKLESARRMKADGMPLELILKYVELTEEELKRLEEQ